MRLGVVGSRGFNDYFLMKDILDEYENIDTIVTGGANGADTWAEHYAKKYGIQCLVIPAEWSRLGRKAGYIRNVEIVNQSDVIIAFWDGKSKGTKLTIDISEKKGKEIRIIEVR